MFSPTMWSGEWWLCVALSLGIALVTFMAAYEVKPDHPTVLAQTVVALTLGGAAVTNAELPALAARLQFVVVAGAVCAALARRKEGPFVVDFLFSLLAWLGVAAAVTALPAAVSGAWGLAFGGR